VSTDPEPASRCASSLGDFCIMTRSSKARERWIVAELQTRLTRSEPVRVLELRSVRGTGGGPEKTILLSAAQHADTAVAVTVCYIRDARDDRFLVDAAARDLGIHYVEIIERHSFDWRIWGSLTRLIRKDRIQIVHSHDYKTDLLGLMLGRATKAVPMATAHGWIRNSPRERAYAHFDKKLLARFPLVIAVSEPIRQELLSHGADPVRVKRIKNGIDHLTFRRVRGLRERARQSLGIPDDAILVGAVGRLEAEKGFDLLLRAVATLNSTLRPWVVIAGEGSQHQALQTLAIQLGISNRVSLLGHRSDTLSIHHAFDVYAQTSRTEGIPNAVLEAMAVGTPVVATNVGGTYELITDGVHGLLVPPEDTNAIASALRDTIMHPADAGARTRMARNRIETELSFASRLSTLEHLYAELLERAGSCERIV
jgi:glycosyltransferase involved in cell wall biosynthesis